VTTPVIIFDVNETLLDLAALDVEFERMFGDPGVRRLWFAQFIQNALVATITNAYAPFGEIGMAALDMVAARRGMTATEAHKASVRQALVHLPPHPDVRPALERLKAAGFRMATLTNSTQAVAEAQLRNAGVADLFEQSLSADSVKRLKPAPEPYQFAAQRMGVTVDGMCLVAAHAWDVAGAMRAGLGAVFVARPGMVPDPLAPTPMTVANNMSDVAAYLIHHFIGR
jgi:2-haloacid dehalogenase